MSDYSLTRRGFIVGTGVAAGSLLIGIRLRAREIPQADDDGIVARMRREGATATIKAQSVREGVSVLMGAGGNIAVLSGADGSLLVDAGLATARPQLSDAISRLNGGPVRHLVNTHWHFDHTDGNDWLHDEGASIVAHENCRRHLSTATRVEKWNHTFEPRLPGALPVVDFKQGLTLHVNNTTIVLDSFAPAHTDSDLLVEFKELDLFHVGDVWWNGHYPFIDYSTGGSIDGTIRACESVLSRAKPTTVIIPGHGPVGDKAQLTEFRDMLVTVRQRVSALKTQGKSLADTIAANPTREFDAKFGHFLMAPADFTGLVYDGV